MNNKEIDTLEIIKCADNSLNLKVTTKKHKTQHPFITNISKELFEAINNDIEKLKEYAIKRFECGSFRLSF